MQTNNILKSSQLNSFAAHLSVFQKKSLGEDGSGGDPRSVTAASTNDALSAKSATGTRELFQTTVISEIKAELNGLLKGNLPSSISEKINDLNSEYWSDDSMAGRIFSFSVGFFGRYREIMKEIASSDSETRKEFTDAVKNALTKGLKKSEDTLSGSKAEAAEMEGIAAKVEEKLEKFSQTK